MRRRDPGTTASADMRMHKQSQRLEKESPRHILCPGS